MKDSISKQLKNGGIYINEKLSSVLDWFGMLDVKVGVKKKFL